MKKAIAVALMAAVVVASYATAIYAQGWVMYWYVVTYSGQKVMGPFLDFSDCSFWARLLSQIYWNVSPFCRLSY